MWEAKHDSKPTYSSYKPYYNPVYASAEINWDGGIESILQGEPIGTSDSKGYHLTAQYNHSHSTTDPTSPLSPNFSIDSDRDRQRQEGHCHLRPRSPVEGFPQDPGKVITLVTFGRLKPLDTRKSIVQCIGRDRKLTSTLLYNEQ